MKVNATFEDVRRSFCQEANIAEEARIQGTVFGWEAVDWARRLTAREACTLFLYYELKLRTRTAPELLRLLLERLFNYERFKVDCEQLEAAFSDSGAVPGFRLGIYDEVYCVWTGDDRFLDLVSGIWTDAKRFTFAFIVELSGVYFTNVRRLQGLQDEQDAVG